MRNSAVFSAALLLAACASSGAVHPNMSRMQAEQGGRASLLVMGDEAVSGDLQSRVRKQLAEAKAYELVERTNIAARTQIEIYVTQAAPVGRAKRTLLGPLAGPASLTAQIVVRQDGKIVDSFVVDSRSSSGSPFAGTTDQAIEIAADRIVERLTS